MKKILFVFGTRPETIKMAPVIDIFKKDDINFKTYVAVTAQHREMLDQVLSVFNIIPDYDLNLMSNNQTLELLTEKIINGVSKILKDIKPDLVFVQGDTTTTFATSLVTFYNKIPVAHIEAGLRTNDMYSPFPEEINRKLSSCIATYHFPPTEVSRQNLISEGISKKLIKVSGNTVIDSLLMITQEVKSNCNQYVEMFKNNHGINFEDKKTILVTIHRRESFGSKFEDICNAIKNIAMNNNVQIIYPVHLNPNIQDPANKILDKVDNIYLIPPQDYLPFVFLMNKSFLILTDSGGVQEEAPSLGKPVFVMRDTTERPEGVTAGTARLVGSDPQMIISAVELLLKDEKYYGRMAKAINPYGNGKASEKIYNFIRDQYNLIS